jgi:hypothetical protein
MNETMYNDNEEFSQTISTHSENENDTSTSTALAIARGRRALAPDYQLNDNDVFCGRGSIGFNHIGNQRYRSTVAATLERYMNTKSRTEKTSIIFEIVDKIRALSPNGGFVKKDAGSGIFYEVGDLVAVRL